MSPEHRPPYGVAFFPPFPEGGGRTNLTRVQRWLLSNQYQILERLDPANAPGFAEKREAIECGYELNIEWISVHVSKDVMSVEASTEVCDILQMFSVLKRAPDIGTADKRQITFAGFDGHTEGQQVAYARYYCSMGPGRYPELDRGDNFNSHVPTLSRYRRQLEAWDASVDKNVLSKSDVERIAQAAARPALG